MSQNRLLIFSAALGIFMGLTLFAHGVNAAWVIDPVNGIEADFPSCPPESICLSPPPQGHICYNGPNTSNPGTCTTGSCNTFGDPWSEYRAVCVQQREFSCKWAYEYVRGFSTADKCVVPETGLRAGLCSPGGVGGQYKTCCVNAAPAQCTTVAPYQDAHAPPEGSCPAGTTEKPCGYDNYPACGPAACASPTLSVTASAIPSSGTAPLNDVDIKAIVGGTATGDITYRFRCTSSSLWGSPTSRTASSLTAENYCDYPTQGTYTAAVKVERQGLSASDTATVVVSAPVAQNRPPTVTISASPSTVLTGAAISVTIVGTDTDSGVATLKLLSEQGVFLEAFSCNGQSPCSHIFSVQYYAAGTYRFKGISTDMAGLSAENLSNPVLVQARPGIGGAVACTASGDWSGSKSPAGGTESIRVLGTANQCKQYTLTCTDSGTGLTSQDSVSVCIPLQPSTCTTINTSLASSCSCGGNITRHTEICSDGRVTVTQTGSCNVCPDDDGVTPGSGDGQQSSGSGAVPQALNLSSTQGNYCFVSWPPIILSWRFSDQDAGDRQTSYQVQVDTTSSFASPDRDSGKVSSSISQYAPAQLSYAATYYWRVRVWDASNQQSNWSSAAVFTTSVHAYPSTDFSWLPATPAAAEVVQFTDETAFSQGAQSRSWTWTFGDGVTSPGQNPSHVYQENREYDVSLRACDDAGCCSKQDIVNIALPFPDIKEISPFNFFQGIFQTLALLAQ